MDTQSFSLLFLVVFSLLSFVDGVYIHLIYYRLHAHPDSRNEHLLHSLRALFFFLILLLLYYFEASGIWLWLGCLIILADYIVESLDMVAEKESRKNLGGLSSFEYWLHGTLVMVRSLSLGLWFSTFSFSRFNLDSSGVQLHLSGYSLMVVEQIMVSTLAVFGLHLLLILKPNILNLFYRRCCGRGVAK